MVGDVDVAAVLVDVTEDTPVDEMTNKPHHTRDPLALDLIESFVNQLFRSIKLGEVN